MKQEAQSNSKSEDTSLDDFARRLHDWYLEATGQLDPKNFNHEAQKPYEQLRQQQKDIDRYIAGQVKAWHKAEVANLLQVIEDEVVASGKGLTISERLEALKQIKERYE